MKCHCFSQIVGVHLANRRERKGEDQSTNSRKRNRGCCPIGLRCTSSLCLEYHYKTLPVFHLLVYHTGVSRSIVNSTITTNLQFDRTLPATIFPISQVNVASPPSPLPPPRPGDPRKSIEDLPISLRVLGTPTASAKKVGMVAVQNGSTREVKTGRERLGWAGLGGG